MLKNSIRNDKKNEFRHESLQDPESIIKYISALKEGFESGELTFDAHDRRIVFSPTGLIKLDVHARRKSNKNKLTVRMVWKEIGNDLPEEPINGFALTSGLKDNEN
jgi:amphi-Trp domain-containing protein